MSHNNYINVGMNKCEITDNGNHIIGCNSLISCIGILLYSEKYKVAGVLHKSIEGDADDDYIKKINSNLLEELDAKLKQEIIRKNGELSDEKIKYLLIPPAMYSDKTRDHINFYEYLLEKKYISFSNEELNNVDIVTIEVGKNEFINCFAFDASVGTFVTKQIFKGEKIVASVNIKGR